MNTLDRIIAAKHREIAALKTAKPPDVSSASAPLGFANALISARNKGHCGIIAEFKRASPSAGNIAANASAELIAKTYKNAGAACLSVLTEQMAFGGNLDDLTRARTASGLPCLRKDFMLDPVQVDQARMGGADAILLILSILDDDNAARMCDRAGELGMDVLVEIHNTFELERALRLPSPLIGINNRNLDSLKVDLDVTERLAPAIPEQRLAVAESGIRSPEDIVMLRRAGASAFLIGSHLMSAHDPAAALLPLVAAAT